MTIDNLGPNSSEIGLSSLEIPDDLKEFQERARQELVDLGLEASAENIEAVAMQLKTSQFPEGYDDILDKLDSPEELKLVMETRGIKSIVHSEGKTVWDHTKLALRQIEGIAGLSDEQRKDLKLIMLYHDCGKTEVYNSDENKTRTRKNLEKGELQQAMINHDKAGLDKIKKGLLVNGVEGGRLEIFMRVIENHMKTSLLEQDPKKTVALFELFGQTDEERKKVVELLTLVLQVDGNATERINLVDGQLKYSKNEKKLKLNFEEVWGKYEQGKEMIKQEQERQKKQQEEKKFEESILGESIPSYLQKRGVKPGPEMGRIIGRIRGVISQNKDKNPSEIKAIIDAMEI